MCFELFYRFIIYIHLAPLVAMHVWDVFRLSVIFIYSNSGSISETLTAGHCRAVYMQS